MWPRPLRNVPYSQLVCGTQPQAHLFPPQSKHLDSHFNNQCMIVIVGLCMESVFHCDSGTPCDLNHLWTTELCGTEEWYKYIYKIRGVGCPYYNSKFSLTITAVLFIYSTDVLSVPVENVCLLFFAQIDSLLCLEAHLLPPLPPQLHAAIKVIVHDAQRFSSLSHWKTQTWCTCWAQNNHQPAYLHYILELQCFTWRTINLDNSLNAAGNILQITVTS